MAGNTSASALAGRPALLGGPGSIPAAELPLGDVSLRADAYRSEPEVVRGWMKQARSLADPAAMEALRPRIPQLVAHTKEGARR